MSAEIRDERGRVLPAGTTGELWVKGPNVMKGFYRDREATAQVLVDGWLQTGDLGLLDDDGYLSLMGRSKELMIVGGHNVYPREIENVLLEDSAIADAAVAARADPVRGERILAFVVPADGVAPDEGELLARCRRRLPSYKVPRKLFVVPAIPRNASGKILRRDLLSSLAE